MAADQLQVDHRLAVVNQSSLRRGDILGGDILVHGKSDTYNYGHISVYIGHDKEASDHIQHLILNGSYGRTVVFRPRGKFGASGVPKPHPIIADETCRTGYRNDAQAKIAVWRALQPGATTSSSDKIAANR